MSSTLVGYLAKGPKNLPPSYRSLTPYYPCRRNDNMDTLFAPLDAWMNAHRVFMALLPFIIFGLVVAYARLVFEPRKKLEERLRWHESLHGAAEKRIRALESRFGER